MENFSLYMTMLGCKPQGRLTEQHDIFFGIAQELKDLIPDCQAFWPEADQKIHFDAWRKVQYVDQHRVRIVERNHSAEESDKRLYFINLGGYKANEFDEFHYKLLTVATSKAEAIQAAKKTAFYKHCGFPGATSHIDDQYGVDVDDLYLIEDILPQKFKHRFQLQITESNEGLHDEIHVGYFKLSSF